jgi:hypothetical protein
LNGGGVDGRLGVVRSTLRLKKAERKALSRSRRSSDRELTDWAGSARIRRVRSRVDRRSRVARPPFSPRRSRIPSDTQIREVVASRI